MATRLTVSQVPVGTYVTAKNEADSLLAYDTGRYGVDPVYFKPGMIGIVAASDVPYVCEKSKYSKTPRASSFLCVDFYTHDLLQNANEKSYPVAPRRVALDYYNVKIVKEVDQNKTRSYDYSGTLTLNIPVNHDQE